MTRRVKKVIIYNIILRVLHIHTLILVWRSALIFHFIIIIIIFSLMFR
jgi:hypothetical protein